ncbi:efflux RND transporter periplasmic adaptor subunit [Croceicoccus ponticola]|uniref:Efflux RND transporter periplasmic adaptor subunit n=1 Tax=Croceicoccus ponticola TaxID=2217664 RepID=A0A437GXL7_9SPHN|nr:efflux RND transporter periplasmic adaptor subunit [Croceicoccus ponticola]RVQ67152.1 efflux RND transporter periplasmic adaptor subunit [Croceicoccus ponticola]
MKAILAGTLALLLTACSAADDVAAPAAVPVKTYTVKAASLPNVVELPGRVEPVRTAEVRARVTGIVQRLLYEEGTFVRAGQPLFRIDPRELRASYAQTQASLQRARATAANARAVVDRYRPLVAENAISKQEFDAAVAASRQSDAGVAEIRAQLDAASLQLGYTTVRAPIGGRAGRAEVTEGALVSQTEGTLLTRIEQTESVYVTFAQSASELLAIRDQIGSGVIELENPDRIEVRLILADGEEYAVPGYIDFLALTVDESTGTIEIRAEFPNSNGRLLPGEFVKARIYAGLAAGGIAVPQRAVMLGQSGGSVYIVDAKGQAAMRKVELGTMVAGQWIVKSGLKPGDRVIVNNLQKIRPGAPVMATPVPTGRNAAKVGAKQAAGAK